MRVSPKITTANTGAALGLRIAPVFPIVKSAPGSDIAVRGRNPVGTRPIQQQSHKQKIRLDCTAMHILTLRWIRNWKRSQIAFPRPPPSFCLGCSAFGRRQRGVTRAREGWAERRGNTRNLVASGRPHRKDGREDAMMKGIWFRSERLRVHGPRPRT